MTSEIILRLQEIYDEYNCKNSTRKTKLITSEGKDHLRTKTVIQDVVVEKIERFKCIGSNKYYMS